MLAAGGAVRALLRGRLGELVELAANQRGVVIGSAGV
jgi:hypothetical protein